MRLGPGSPNVLSPDGKWALVLRQNMSPPDFALLPTGVGQQRTLATGKVIPNSGQFLPDSKHLLLDGHEPGHSARLYVMGLEGEQPRPISPEGFHLGPVAPDGKHLAAVTSEGIALISVDSGEPQPVRGSQPGEIPLRWTKDGRVLFIGRRGETACQVFRLDVGTGTRTPWKTFNPPDLAGVTGVSCPRLAADEEHYVYGYIRNLSDLFLVDHLR